MAPKKEVAAARAAAIEAAAQRVVAVETNPEEPTLEKKVSDLQTATRDAVERLDVVDERLDELENKGDRIQEEIQDNVTPNTGRPCVATVLGGVSRPSNVRASDLIKSQWVLLLRHPAHPCPDPTPLKKQQQQ
ncbi:hypothetical protein V6N13_003803 [Hibiscus sabdariffa]